MRLFLPTMDFRNLNVELSTEVFSCHEDCQALGFRPEVKLIAVATARMAVILMRDDVDNEGTWIVVAFQWTESTDSITSTVIGLKIKQSQDVEDRDLVTKKRQADVTPGDRVTILAIRDHSLGHHTTVSFSNNASRRQTHVLCRPKRLATSTCERSSSRTNAKIIHDSSKT